MAGETESQDALYEGPRESSANFFVVKRLVDKYFGGGLPGDYLTIADPQNQGSIVFLRAEDRSHNHGYVFVMRSMQDDYEGVMERKIRQFENEGRHIEFKFVDKRERISGFSWRDI